LFNPKRVWDKIHVDRGVWVLKCSNATYRISRSPDMAAKVERSDDRSELSDFRF